MPEHNSPVPTAPSPTRMLLYLDLQCYRDILLIRFQNVPWNAFALRQWEELDRVFTALLSDDGEEARELLPGVRSSVHGAVLVGSKTMFSVGNDTTIWKSASDAYKQAWLSAAQTCRTHLAELVTKLPVVAALSGYTCGEAWELATQCSYRVMGDNARLYPSPERGFISPKDALAAGMVECLAAPDLVLNEAQEWLLDRRRNDGTDR